MVNHAVGSRSCLNVGLFIITVACVLPIIIVTIEARTYSIGQCKFTRSGTDYVKFRDICVVNKGGDFCNKAFEKLKAIPLVPGSKESLEEQFQRNIEKVKEELEREKVIFLLVFVPTSVALLLAWSLGYKLLTRKPDDFPIDEEFESLI